MLVLVLMRIRVRVVVLLRVRLLLVLVRVVVLVLGWLLVLVPGGLLVLVLLLLLRDVRRVGLLVRWREMLGVRRRSRRVRLVFGVRLPRVGGDGRGGEVQQRAVGRVAQVYGRGGVQLAPVDATAVYERAVGAAVVLEHPTAAVEADRGVPPGDPGVGEHDVALRIASQGVGPGRIECPGLPV
ncbi:hypothetical protein GCM10010259_51870 [Streptomyces daghestanicus]|nr:hypothetical protein GCM10010259_51870 [Streptomyces daghestanicus]